MLAKMKITYPGTLRSRGNERPSKYDLDHFDDEILMLFLELSDIELFKYFRKESHS